MNTGSHFHKQMQEVKSDLLRMAGLVEEAIHDSSSALARRDAELAMTVISKDRPIDMMQNQIEERCIALLATQQPVAVDLRFLSAVIKICAYLERMGDQAVNIAQRSLALKELLPTEVPPTILDMAEISQDMARACMDALANGDLQLVCKVLARDKDLDDLNRQVLEDMVEWMATEQRLIRRGVEFILAARHYERVGDEATNIAEEVVFLVEGRIIRHQGGMEPREPDANAC
ncbi:MAG: phosphate signaling complex protein PhoU [Desulfarculus sp.]|nr:phosphate signaling complex protein PhoU [Desulfarculus sp.]